MTLHFICVIKTSVESRKLDVGRVLLLLFYEPETQSRSHKISRQKLFSLKKWLPFPVIANNLFVYFFRRFSLLQWLAFAYCCNSKQPKELWCQILVFFTFVLTAPFIPRFSIFVKFDDSLFILLFFLNY